MIKKFADIIKEEVFEYGKKYSIDKWFGSIDFQYHITNIILVNDKETIIWYDKMRNIELSDEFISREYWAYLNIVTSEFIWADTLSEALSDYEKIKRGYELENKLAVEGCINALKKFFSSYEKLDYGLKREVDKIIKSNRNKEFDLINSHLGCWVDLCDNGYYDEDDLYNIRDIFKSHSIRFRDKDHSNIFKDINLNFARAVYECSHNGKDCICFEMANDEAFYLYEEKGSFELYLAVKLLYGL